MTCYEKSTKSRRKVDKKLRFVTKCYEKSLKSRRLLRYFPPVLQRRRDLATRTKGNWHYETVVEDAGVKTPTLNDAGNKPVRTTRSAKLNYKE